MKLLGVGIGRSGTYSLAAWLRASFEPHFNQLQYPGSDQAACKYIASLHCDRVVGHNFKTYIPLVEKIWPDCKYIWLRRLRDENVASLAMCNFGVHAHADRVGSIGQLNVPLEIEDRQTKAEWLYDRASEVLTRDLLAIPSGRKRIVWLHEIDDQRTELAEWLGDPELAERPFPHRNATKPSAIKPGTIPSL